MDSDQWSVTLEGGKTLPNPTWEQLEALLDQVDGSALSFLTLNRTANGSLWVAGGNEGRYLVIYMKDTLTQESLTLADNSLQGADVELLIEGVASQYPARLGVGKSLVLEAFKHFFNTGQVPDHLSWENY